ncbi:hypothetical protein [Legionella tucsonensis]|uniref:Uncharacterized protein n=1 Tax=Legionella tucsonensis TaxID=40335 RepID=A0A0W0ZZ52_9GAMM|nr:hypothetical protein [Legionella tucsonensis]KTD74383.1 hypothetical protein Ltuc_2230 [Legionella tucsonensis]
MDAIQLALDVHLKKTIYNPQRFFFKQQELSEATCPLLISYLAWLRKIKATPNKFDVMHQNEQKNREFKFLCKRNLLFFLTVTGQFNVIEKLFKTSSLTTKLRHLITLIKKERYKIRQKKSIPLKISFPPKAKIHNLEQKHSVRCLLKMSLFNYDIKKTQQLSFAHTVRRIKFCYLVYISKIELLGKILKAVNTNPNLQSHIKKTLLHQIIMVYRRTAKNKALFTAPINQNAQTPRTFELILQAWKQLHDDVLEINSIFNQCRYLNSELEKNHKDEITASMKFVDELENLMQGNYALRDEIDLKKTLNTSAESGVYTPIDEDSNIASTKQYTPSAGFEKRSNIKKSPFMSHDLTFFSPPQIALRAHFNFSDQKTENNFRAGC